METNFAKLTDYAKTFTGFTVELEDVLRESACFVLPRLAGITEDFYRHLSTVKEAASFLEGRVDNLKSLHTRWLESLFTGPYDEKYVESLYNVGYVHVKVNLPVEFMAGAMTLINSHLIRAQVEHLAGEPMRLAKTIEAINAVTGMSLFVMQQAYQEASLAEELERFLKITGMSRTLFSNLALAYKNF